MTAAEKTHAVIVARMRGSSIAFVSRLRTGGFLTRLRQQAWVMTVADAEDAQQRFHAVQADGHYHQDVLFYDVCTVKLKRSRNQGSPR